MISFKDRCGQGGGKGCNPCFRPIMVAVYHYDVNIKMVLIYMAPPKKDTEALTLRLSRSLIDAIDDRRRLESDLPTRPEMIRRALVQWLESEQKK